VPGGWGQQPGQPAAPGGWGQQPGQPAAPGGWGQQPGQPAAPGGWGQQSGQPGQPGWGGAPAPGYSGPPTQAGGFGVPGQQPYPGGPGGPGWGGPGGPGAPDGGNDKKKNLIITVVAALVLLVVIAVVLVITLGGDDGDSTTASSGSSSPTSSATPEPAPSSSSSGGFSSAPSSSAAPVADEFIASLPLDFIDCAEQPLQGDGDLVAATCGSSSTQPGPAAAAFAGYPEQTSLDGAFQSDVVAAGLTPFEGAADCTVSGYAEWTFNATDETGGLLGCGLTPDGNAFVYWTDYEFLVQGIVTMAGTTQDDVVTLYDWWTTNSNFR